MTRITRGFAALGAALAIASASQLVASPASAHEQRQVGAYQLTVGWQHEPTYTGTLNAIQIFIKDAAGKPVDDLGSPVTLKVDAGTGVQTSDPLELKGSWDPDTGLGTHGEFDAALLPTRPGTYTLHFTGTINGQKIDQKFTSSDKTFDDVQAPTGVEFPAKDPAVADLAQSVNRIGPRADSAASNASDAARTASTATTLAIVALGAAVVLGAAGIAVASRKRPA